MKYQIQFSGKIKINTNHFSTANFSQRVVKVKKQHCDYR